MTEIEKQIDTIRKLHGVPMACPACQKPTSIWQASGMDPLAYNGHNHPTEFRCPHCGVKLEYLVPVFAIEPYIWRIAEPVVPAKGD